MTYETYLKWSKKAKEELRRKGKFIVVNKEESGKSNRGFLAAAYRLLQPAFIYPVINASAFYIDDFPAPIPDGENAYIDSVKFGMKT